MDIVQIVLSFLLGFLIGRYFNELKNFAQSIKAKSQSDLSNFHKG